MKSSWINIDRLGTRGIEPDLMPPHRDPQSLDVAVNVRALGANIANAGGYRLVPNGSLPQETIPSSCACPDQHYELTLGDGEYHIDRSWFWDWSDPSDRFFQVFAFQVRLEDAEYDQTLVFNQGDCENFRLARCEIQILNTAAARRVRIETFDAAGASQGYLLDYDASAEFTDGNPHWVFVERKGAVGATFRVNLDATTLGEPTWSTTWTADYVSVVRANSPANLYLPVAIWEFGQTIWDCLTSGSYTGLGRCVLTGAQNPLTYDLSKSSVDLWYRRGGAVVATKLGTPTHRNAWIASQPTGQRAYWEHAKGSPNCRSQQIAGGCNRTLDLGQQLPGRDVGSFGLESDGSIYVDGVLVAPSGSPITTWDRALFAFDPITGEVWIGHDESGTQVWARNPETEAGYVSAVTDLAIISHLENENEAMRVISGSGCRYAPPTGFGDILPL